MSLAGADHLLSRSSDAVYVAEVIAAWAKRYLDPVAPEQAASKPNAAPRNVVVRETRDSKYQNDVVVGPHHLFADERPQSVARIPARDLMSTCWPGSGPVPRSRCGCMPTANRDRWTA